MNDFFPAVKNGLSAVGKKAVIAFCAAVFIVLLAIWLPTRVRTVTVNCDGKITVAHTSISDPDKIIDRLGIELTEGDSVTSSGFEALGFFEEGRNSEAEININRLIDVCIEADSLLYHTSVKRGSKVSDALNASGLTVREDDLLSVSEDSAVSEGQQLKLTRIDYITVTEEEVIPRGTVTRGTSLVKNRKVAVSYGKNGTLLKTYSQKLIDGVYDEKTLVSEEVIKRATDDVFVYGDGSAISPLDYGYTIVDGTPTEYTKVYENVRATGYYASYGAGTATGRLAQVGYVAVDPKIVPYGSKLWIVAHGRDGFVYGYALAADTGGAMLSGKNFVDLYYETYYECVLHGLRYVDVYVLE